MRLILESHSDIYCYDEILAYDALAATDADFSQGAHLTGYKIPRWTEQLLQPTLTLGPDQPPMRNFYRGEKLVFMFRSVLDTLASMRRYRIGEYGWSETFVPSIILSRSQTLCARYPEELQFISGCGHQLAGLDALYWRYKTEAYFDYFSNGLPVIPVSYERLVTEPEMELRLVCNALGVEFQEALLSHHTYPHMEVYPETGLTVGGTDPAKPIHSDSVSQWKYELSDPEIEVIQYLTDGLSERVNALFRHDPQRYAVGAY